MLYHVAQRAAALRHHPTNPPISAQTYRCERCRATQVAPPVSIITMATPASSEVRLLLTIHKKVAQVQKYRGKSIKNKVTNKSDCTIVKKC